MGRTPRGARVAAAALAVSLVSLPFAVAAGSAYAAAPPPQVTSPVNGSYVAPTDLIRFEGVDATYGFAVEVLVDDAPVCFTESTPEGVWFCETEAGVADGAHTVVARQTVDTETSTGTVVGYTIGVAPEPEPEPEPPVEEPVEPPVVTPVEPPVETPAAPPIETPAEVPAEVPAETPAAAPTVEPAPPAAAAPAA
ncbi:hypothetical protein, partial [Conyzicola sp.]|uniref:hypothetical protein n=1 Tax=Conyzicola sp. TaxID=1969404 RepID=UPI00398A2C58